MHIDRRRIRNLANYIDHLPQGVSLRVRTALSDRETALLERVGFEAAPAQGDSLLPAARGSVSRFNAEGRWQVHRDLPKEDRYIRTVSWTWKEWGGTEHTEFRDITRLCYQRTLITPPGIEMTYLRHGGQAYLVSPALSNTTQNEAALLHAINLVLEIAGTCEIVADDLSNFAPPVTRRVSWRMLPPGAHPWERIRSHVNTSLARMTEKTRSVVHDRQRTIVDHGPDEQHVGLGGFSDYVAYVFRQRRLVVLESIRRGNAIYVFGDDWQAVAQLSKAEIIAGNLHLDRIVHSDGWKARLAQTMNQRRAA